MTATKRVLDRLSGVKETRSGWSARCPAHEDRNASLSIAEGDDGRAVVHCHAGCGHREIVQALGLEERDLFDGDSTRPAATTRSSSSKAAKPSGKAYATADAARAAYERTLGRPAAHVWEYVVSGEVVGLTLRWDKPDGSKDTIRPVSRHADGWRQEHMPALRPLFNLDVIRETLAAGRPIHVVEGEKKVVALESLDLLGTTSAGGANSAKQSDWSPLAGREVVILPDADDAGRKYADDVAAILHELDPPAIVRVVEFDGLEPGGDVADLYAACDGDDEIQALRERIERLADEAEPLTPASKVSTASTSSATPATSKATTTSSPVEVYRPYPVDALPEPLAAFVAETAAAIGCDPAYVALPLVTVAGAAIGTTRRLELKAGYAVPAILWTAIVGESGTSKSPALRATLEHVRGHERRLREEYALELRDYKAAKEAYEKARAAWRADKKAGSDPPPPPAEPRGRRAVVTETTVEALAVKLADNPRGLLLARDELDGWFKGMDRYAGKSGGGGSDEAFYLSAYNGESHAVDRRTGDRREIFVASAALWITGGIQPAILRRALGRERRDSGLAARLLLTAPPARPAKWSEEEVSPITRQILHDVLDRLYGLQAETDAAGHEEPRLLRLDAEAKAAYVEWHDRHCQELAELTGDKAAAWSKLRETAARLALIIHEVRVADREDVAADIVDADSVDRALRLVEWHKYELGRVYNILGQSDEEADARQADDRLAAWIERHGGTATARDVLTGCYRWLQTTGEVEAALQRLVVAGRGQWIDRPAGERGGRPTRDFVLASGEAARLKPKPPSAKPRREAVGEGFACADAGAESGEEVVEI